MASIHRYVNRAVVDVEFYINSGLVNTGGLIARNQNNSANNHHTNSNNVNANSSNVN